MFPKSNHINSCKISIYFVRKNLLFLFYTLTFTKLPHQLIYSTHLFNKIIISFNTNPGPPSQRPEHRVSSVVVCAFLQQLDLQRQSLPKDELAVTDLSPENARTGSRR